MTVALLRFEVCGGNGMRHLGACGSRLTPLCSGTAPVRQHGRTHTPDPSRRDHTTQAASCRSRVQRWCRQLLLGNQPSNRDRPHTAFVLTWSKVKERQISTGRVFQSTKRLCHKGFRVSALPALCGFLRKSGGNRRMCQWENCAHLNDLCMKKRRTFYRWQKPFTTKAFIWLW